MHLDGGSSSAVELATSASSGISGAAQSAAFGPVTTTGADLTESFDPDEPSEASASDTDAELDYSEERWAAVEEELDNELPFAAGSSEDEEEDDKYYFILSRPAPGGDIYQASRVGDVERVKYLLEHEPVDVNKRDRWDSVPLYYACLAGHPEVAELLLEHGATCNEWTFDGDRCHYASLTNSIRALLRRYEQRPPPLSPLASALRSVCTLTANHEAIDTTPRPGYWDVVFVLAGERIPLHRAVLAARSPFFHKMLHTAWLPPEDGGIREVLLRPDFLTPEALRALVVYIYSERLDISMASAPVMEKIAHKVKCKDLERAVQRELYTMRYYFKSTHRGESAPRRFVLQPGALPAEVQLSAQLGSLRTWAAAQQAEGNLGPGPDYADVIVRVHSRQFRCHRVILSTRSDYIAALLQRSEDAPPDDAASGGRPRQQQQQQLQTLELHGVSAEVFDIMLTYIYTDELPRLGSKWLTSAGVEHLLEAADLHLLLGMKRAVADAVLDNIESAMRAGAKPSLEHLCRLLLTADSHSVPALRDSCLAAIAHRFDALAAAGDAGDRDVAVLATFIQAVAPHIRTLEDFKEDELEIEGRSAGNIEGGNVGGIGRGTILQDLRDAYLEGKAGTTRDAHAIQFDEQVLRIKAMVAADD